MFTAKEARNYSNNYVEKKIRESAEEGYAFCTVRYLQISKKTKRQLKRKGFKVKLHSDRFKRWYVISW